MNVVIVPANEASWDDIVAIFGTADYPGRCRCQRFKVAGWIWRDSTIEERTAMLRAHLSAGRGHRRVRPRAWRPGARGVPDDHPAGQGDHLGRAARGCPPGVRGGRVHRDHPPDAAARGHENRLPVRGMILAWSSS